MIISYLRLKFIKRAAYKSIHITAYINSYMNESFNNSAFLCEDFD